jgi:hypothetical protein
MGAMEQLATCRNLVKKADSLAQSMGKRSKCSVNIVLGLVQFSVHCENPEKALLDFIEMQESGELDIPGDNAEAPIARYFAISDGPPILTMLAMADDDKNKGFLSDGRRQAMRRLGSLLSGVKKWIAKETEAQNTASNTNDHFSVGFGLNHLTAVEQVELCYCLADQIDRFAKSSGDGYLSTVNIINGLLQISVHTADPEKVSTDFLAKWENGEIDNGDSVFEYVAMGKVDPCL